MSCSTKCPGADGLGEGRHPKTALIGLRALAVLAASGAANTLRAPMLSNLSAVSGRPKRIFALFRGGRTDSSHEVAPPGAAGEGK